jgi:hypothetical protein
MKRGSTAIPSRNIPRDSIKGLVLASLFILCLGAYAAPPTDPVQEARKAAAKGPPCYYATSLTDSAGKVYCFLCKSDTLRISIRRTAISKAELERIYKSVMWLDTLK